MPDTSHSEGYAPPRPVDERAPCEPHHERDVGSKTYIRTYIRGTFGYIRIHSGNFRYIRTGADQTPDLGKPAFSPASAIWFDTFAA